MNRKRILLILILLITIISNSCADNTRSEEFIKRYIDYSLDNSLTENYNPKTFYHPDAIWPGGEKTEIRIISSYKIIDVVDELMTRNLFNPKEELITIITVEFDIIGKLNIDSKLVKENDSISVIYYLSSSYEDEPRIIDINKPDIKFVSFDSYEEFVKTPPE